MQETQEMPFWSLGGEGLLEQEMATYCSILAGKMPWTEEPGGLQPLGLHRVGHDWALSVSTTVFSFPFLICYSVAQSCPTLCNPWTAAHQASLSITNSQSLLRLMSIKSVMPSNHLILWCPLLLLPSTFPSIRDFSNESSVCIRWPKYWSFSFNISPSNENSGLISFKIDWLDSKEIKPVSLKINMLQLERLKKSLMS